MDMLKNDSPDQSQGYVICIAVLPDGTFTVDRESIEQEASEDEGAEPGSMISEPVNSFGEALKKALSIYESEGTSDADAEFDAGYNNADMQAGTVDVAKKLPRPM